MTHALHINAHAKLNLALSVGPPEPADAANPGFHPIASWIVPIALADDVTAERLDHAASSHFDITWHDGAPVDWPVESDLAFRAHRLMEHLAGRPLPARITIRKRIPAGGGLGGGSSNAAAVIRALAALFDLAIGEQDLHAAAATLGSDIPFFLDLNRRPTTPPRPAVVTGFGETIERLPTNAHAGRPVVLIFPPFGCPTPEVYQAADANPEPLREADVRSLAASPTLDAEALFNDLAAPAQRVRPMLAKIRANLAAASGMPIHVSGSGSTLFALPPDNASADQLESAAAAASLEYRRTTLR